MVRVRTANGAVHTLQSLRSYSHTSAIMNMRTIKASEKAKCLQLMNEVAETGETIVVTKNGQPVGPVVSRATTLAGAHRGQITIRGDIVAPVDAAWEAACES
ncbi:MAG: type II toxin-antitoxin system Phd/YefM family antitoxin [Beggiatoa sp.]|nr:type II toxin-antitoxin system Phd/YefM family antitoxin [Beggiatoa sp.]